MPTALLVCFDPGLTTGVALFRDGALFDTVTVRLDDMHFFLEFKLPRFIVPRETEIVVESFIGMRLTTEARLTLQLIGSISYAVQVYLARPPTFQRPQERLSFLPEARQLVKQLPVQEHWQQHHYDSVAHGLKFFYDKEGGAYGDTVTLQTMQPHGL